MEEQPQAGASWSAGAYGAAQAGVASDDGQKNLWIGELQYWMDENYLWNCFASTNDVSAVPCLSPAYGTALRRQAMSV